MKRGSKLPVLLSQLGAALNASIGEDPRILFIIEELREQGLRPELFFEATIVLEKNGFAPSKQLLLPLIEPTPLVAKDGKVLPDAFSEDDAKLLKKLCIKIDTPSE